MMGVNGLYGYNRLVSIFFLRTVSAVVIGHIAAEGVKPELSASGRTGV